MVVCMIDVISGPNDVYSATTRLRAICSVDCSLQITSYRSETADNYCHRLCGGQSVVIEMVTTFIDARHLHTTASYSFEHYCCIIDHPRSSAVYNFSRVCLSVCRHVCQTITFESLHVRNSYLHIRCMSTKYGLSSYMKIFRSRLRFKVKVTGARKVDYACSCTLINSCLQFSFSSVLARRRHRPRLAGVHALDQKANLLSPPLPPPATPTPTPSSSSSSSSS